MHIIESPVVQSLINCDHEYVSLHENSWCKVLSDDKVKISLWMCVTLGSTAQLNGGKLNWLNRWRWRAAQMTWSFQWSHNVTQQQASVTFPHGFRLIHLDKWCSSACGMWNSLMFIVSQLGAVLWSCWSTTKQTFSDGTISVYMNLIAHMKVKEKWSPHQNKLECKVQLNS